MHRELDRHSAAKHIFRCEPHSAAADVARSAYACLGGAMPIEHLVSHLLVDPEALFPSSLALSTE